MAEAVMIHANIPCEKQLGIEQKISLYAPSWQPSCKWICDNRTIGLFLIIFPVIFHMGYQHGSLQLQPFQSLVHQIFLARTKICDSTKMLLVIIQFIVAEQQIRVGRHNYRGDYQLETRIFVDIRYIHFLGLIFPLTGTCYHIYILQLGYHEKTYKLITCYIPSYFSHGILA